MRMEDLIGNWCVGWHVTWGISGKRGCLFIVRPLLQTSKCSWSYCCVLVGDEDI
jgi:hypothetical protein